MCVCVFCVVCCLDDTLESLLTVLLDNLQELDDHLRRRSDEHLSLAGLFSVVDGLESVCENGGSGHSAC